MTAGSRPLVVVGDAMLDRDVTGRAERLSPDAPVPVLDEDLRASRPGGAALAAALAAASGAGAVVLITAIGDDLAGEELRDLVERAGVTLVDSGTASPTPEKVRLQAGERPLLRLDRGGTATPPGRLPPAGSDALGGAGAVLVSDYGRGVAAAGDVRRAVAVAQRTAPVVWDPHPRGPEPVAGSALVTPNRQELAAAGFLGGEGRMADLVRGAEHARRRWGATAVAVTMGAEGALLATGGGPPLAVPAPASAGGDTCGAGDRFASAAAAALLVGRVLSEAVVDAVAAASAFVAGGGASSFAAGTAAPSVAGGPSTTGSRGPRAGSPSTSAVLGLAAAARTVAAVRRRGGTVVATGGCFDILHAGHVQLLTSARALGDCLVVCVNSDRSVRQLKGPSRPVVPEADRVAMLAALVGVDAVVTFDEPTPVSALSRLRPDVFVKGGDYGSQPLPETEALARWGGQVVVVPYMDGRSTTGVLRQLAKLRP